jgi:GT2 family glycosyltransferase
LPCYKIKSSSINKPFLAYVKYPEDMVDVCNEEIEFLRRRINEEAIQKPTHDGEIEFNVRYKSVLAHENLESAVMELEEFEKVIFYAQVERFKYLVVGFFARSGEAITRLKIVLARFKYLRYLKKIFMRSKGAQKKLTTLAINAYRSTASRFDVNQLISKKKGLLPINSIDYESLPIISVIMVSYNQAAYLEDAILSVLDQDYPKLNLIIVDGASTDGSVEIIERYRQYFSKVIIEPDEGQSDALNKGFEYATGDIMNWLCSDDLLAPQSLFNVGVTFTKHRVDLVAGGCTRISGKERTTLYDHHSFFPLSKTVRLSAKDILKFMHSWQKGNYFFQPELFFSRRIWERSGACVRKNLYYGMDYDLVLRFALAGASIRRIPEVIGISRIHEHQKTQSDEMYLYQFEGMMRDYTRMFQSLPAA